ncbi:MAG: hypothetical protein IMW93_05135 [Thermoanaerobacteraceae bacterium]|nr:hypothetical protein [Thermoanaerobacteraceae bacterium]
MAAVVPDSYYLRQQEAVRLTGEGPFPAEKDLLAGVEGLTQREMLILRLGDIIGQGQWDVVRDRLKELGALCSADELWRMFAEVVLIRGEPARCSLSEILEELYPGQGWRKKDSVQLIEFARQGPGISVAERAEGRRGLTGRELSLLGIGISFGARCWYT